MKVKKAIELFEKHNPEAVVRLHGPNGDGVVAIITGVEDKSTACFVDQSEYVSEEDEPVKTVKELVEELKLHNPDADLKLHLLNGETALFIVCYNDDDENVWIESESDVDMSYQLESLFQDAVEEGMDELDVYMELLDTGVDVDMVRRNLGEEAADHMETFCKEHGLI